MGYSDSPASPRGGWRPPPPETLPRRDLVAWSWKGVSVSTVMSKNFSSALPFFSLRERSRGRMRLCVRQQHQR